MVSLGVRDFHGDEHQRVALPIRELARIPMFVGVLHAGAVWQRPSYWPEFPWIAQAAAAASLSTQHLPTTAQTPFQ